MNEPFVENTVINGLTVPEFVYLGIIVVLLLAILFVLRKAFLISRDRPNAGDILETVAVHCVSCAWDGEVPRLRKVCPRCSGTTFV